MEGFDTAGTGNGKGPEVAVLRTRISKIPTAVSGTVPIGAPCVHIREHNGVPWTCSQWNAAKAGTIAGYGAFHFTKNSCTKLKNIL